MTLPASVRATRSRVQAQRAALAAAQTAADAAFDAYLSESRATASQYVPTCVIDAAKAAFADTNGRGEIVVRGHGNCTHPVCSVEVRHADR